MAESQTTRSYLRQLRIDAGKTMQEVADAFGISRQYYEMIESGERQKKMDITMLVKVADLFGVTLDYVVEQERALREGAEGETEPDAEDGS